MAVLLRDGLRGAWRGCVLFVLLIGCIAHYVLLRPSSLADRARLRRLWCARVLRILRIRLRVHGEPPACGVIAGNHLGYLDILTYGAVLDSIFVSKIEVRSWPLIGLITRFAGTIYVDRAQRGVTEQSNAEISAVLAQGRSVTFFPEGTTTDGGELLRFRAALFEAPLQSGDPVWPAAIAYRLGGRSEGVSEKVCYWGDMVFGPHLLQFLRLRDVSADLYFAAEPVYGGDRFELANRSHAVVSAMLAADAAEPRPHPSEHGASLRASGWEKSKANPLRAGS